MSVVNPIPIMMRYLDGGKPELSNDEREILLFALYIESVERIEGLAHRAVVELQKQGKMFEVAKPAAHKSAEAAPTPQVEVCGNCGSFLYGKNCDSCGAQVLKTAAHPLDQHAQGRPRIVCLCGSTRFYDYFQHANYEETMAGRIVLSVGFYPHAQKEMHHSEDVGCTAEQKVSLDELHKRKIDVADEILVLNVGGYIGSSTRSEIDYAEKHDKPVRYLEVGFPVSVMGDGDYSCATCGMGMKEPCEHWKRHFEEQASAHPLDQDAQATVAEEHNPSNAAAHELRDNKEGNKR